MTELHELDSSSRYIGNEADKEAVSSMSGVRSRCCGSSEGSIRARPWYGATVAAVASVEVVLFAMIDRCRRQRRKMSPSSARQRSGHAAPVWPTGSRLWCLECHDMGSIVCMTLTTSTSC